MDLISLQKDLEKTLKTFTKKDASLENIKHEIEKNLYPAMLVVCEAAHEQIANVEELIDNSNNDVLTEGLSLETGSQITATIVLAQQIVGALAESLNEVPEGEGKNQMLELVKSFNESAEESLALIADLYDKEETGDE